MVLCKITSCKASAQEPVDLEKYCRKRKEKEGVGGPSPASHQSVVDRGILKNHKWDLDS
jgi:hypothetical protein